ncbi:hypothetical protein [Bradyrhizobium prioriisuperbiae]|uniref:hypothetical protein n=1 Tax=Bradyrhizobium prioriisuperbiae TaxID=2854389 RepID=UPI0028E30C06|nr:hypothetical protein [Bradyrhizobium prioritasuperba]
MTLIVMQRECWRGSLSPGRRALLLDRLAVSKRKHQAVGASILEGIDEIVTCAKP